MKNYLNGINNLNVSNIDVTNNKEKKRYDIAIAFNASDYGILNMDETIIFNLNVLNRSSYVPNKEINRKTPFEIARGFKDEDIYKINIPENYSIVELPKSQNIESQFGTYTMSVEKKSEYTLEYKRTFLLKKGLYKKELYEDFRKFLKKIRKLENIKMIIIKQ